MKNLKTVFALIVLIAFADACLEAENVIINRRKNVSNSSDGTSKINSGIDLGDRTREGIKGNGKIITQTRKESGFHGISANGTYKLQINSSAGSAFLVSLKGDSNIIDKIKTSVKKGILYIKAGKSFSTENPIELKISAPELDKIVLSGSSECDICIDGRYLDLKAGGASEIKLSGKLDKFVLDIGGSASVDSSTCRANEVKITSTGTAEASVAPMRKLDVNASGTSDIVYSGKPEVIKNIKFPASLEKR